MRFHQSDVLVVNIAVPNRMDESIHTGLQEIFCVCERRRAAEVRERFHSVLVRLIDDRAIHLGLELRYGAFTIVDPEFDEVDAACVQLTNVLPALFRSRRAVRNAEPGFTRRTRHRGCRDAFSDCQEFRRIRNDLVPELVRQFLIGLEPHAHRRRRSVVGVAL